METPWRIISRHTFVCHNSRNVLAKFDENRPNLYTLLFRSKWLFSPQNQRFQVIKFRKQLAQRQEVIISPPKTANQSDNRTSWRQWRWSRFPAKSIPLQTRFTFQWSVEEDDTIMGKVAKGEGKTHGKNGKNRKMCWDVKQRIDRQLSKLRFEAIANVFASWLILV